MLIGLAVVALVVVGLGLAVRLCLSRDAEIALRPEERVVIRELGDPLPGNSFLACPPGYCAAAAAPSPVFALPAERLADVWRRMLAAEPEVFPVASDPEAHRFTVIQRTRLLHFPDIVTVEFVALGPDRSSLAVYSRARYGRGDLGTNRKRVMRWLSRLGPLAAG
jgi:uncharacterized protein (DUF1499 family)